LVTAPTTRPPNRQEPPGGPDAVFRVLKIDRTVPERLDITDDGVNYNKKAFLT